MKVAVAFFIVQLLLLGILIFGDIGFDHPGKYGLDFDDFIKIATLYAGGLLAGVLYAGFRRQWKVLILQVATPLLLWFVMVVAPQHLPPLDPADYQHLVGKTEKEVREAIGSWRIRTSGFGGDENGEYGFEHYDGMSIYYTHTREPRVTSVQAD